MISGIAGRPFSAETLPPSPKPEKSNKEKIIKVSRERYGTPQRVVEEKISRWSGVLTPPATPLPPVPPVLYDARCSLCGKDTKVVFPPDGTRPVYCKPCRKKLEREREQKRTVQRPEKISLKEAMSEEPLPFSPSKREKIEREKKRKTINLEELKKALEESLAKEEISEKKPENNKTQSG